MLSVNVIIPYDNTNASIPNGFVRETALDGRYPKGWGTTTPPGTAGGAATHTHTSAAHSHAPTNHTHTFITKAIAANPDGIGGSGQGNTVSKWYHYHTGVTSVTTGGTNETPTWGTASNDPPYYEVIFIKADSYQLIPRYGIVYRSGIGRSGMSIHAASVGKYLKGAATGGNAGATGGSFTNTHTIGHTHNAYHGHSGTSTTSQGDSIQSQGSTGTASDVSHTHGIHLNDTTTALAASTPTDLTINSELNTNVEPEHRTLNAYYAPTSSVVPMAGDICLWLGTPESIPLGWKLCDGTNDTVDMRDKFCKIPSTAPSASVTGGRNTHSHTGQVHIHTATQSHTHTGYDDYSNDVPKSIAAGNDGYRQFPNHNHTGLQSISSGSVIFGSATFTPNASDNQPLYTTVAYIQFVYSAVGGSFIYNLL
jgi:hypothetical protein